MQSLAGALPVLLPALISGFATFALQVLWNRAFAQVHENSMYAFAVIVAVVWGDWISAAIIAFTVPLIPLLAADIAVLLLVTYFESLSLFLVHMIF